MDCVTVAAIAECLLAYREITFDFQVDSEPRGQLAPVDDILVSCAVYGLTLFFTVVLLQCMSLQDLFPCQLLTCNTGLSR